jgi:uroporphyrinogen III methyltransferase/synthase
VATTLGTLAARVEEAGLGPPSVIVVGPVAGLAATIGAEAARPLAGRRVVVTRARAQASELSERLRALGAAVTELPAIRIERLPERPELASALEGLGDYGLVVLTSVNGVDALFDALAARGRDARALSAAATVVAIGPATAERLARRGVRADVVPERFVAEGVLEALAGVRLEGARALVARAAGSRPELVDGLERLGARVDEVLLYEAVPEPADPAAVAEALGADYLTFTASSTVRAFARLLGDADRARLADGGPRVVSIGPVTSATAREEGLRVAAEAAEHTIPGLVAALLDDAG